MSSDLPYPSVLDSCVVREMRWEKIVTRWQMWFYAELGNIRTMLALGDDIDMALYMTPKPKTATLA